MQVLIVDSSLEIIERLQQMLSEIKSVGTVYGAVAFKDGVDFFRKINPSVVLVDSGLRGNESFELIKEIRQAGSKTQVIVLLNGEEELLYSKFRSLGVDFFFDKYHEFEKIPGAFSYIATERKETLSNGI
jgi:DNA-binding response OmpR family regulator